MSETLTRPSTVRHPDCFFIGGQWVAPSARTVINVFDSASEEVFLTVAEAQAEDIDRVVAAAREAFDNGPWPRMTPRERAVYLNRIADAIASRAEAFADSWTQEAGVLRSMSAHAATGLVANFRFYAGLADSYTWIEPRTSSTGQPALLVREAVGVVAAIVPWNAPAQLMVQKVAPALIAGCAVIVKASPEAPVTTGRAAIVGTTLPPSGRPAATAPGPATS